MTSKVEKEREHYHFMAEGMRALERDLRGRLVQSGRVPEEWHEIARRPVDRPKEKVTFWVDADVLRFFKSMGKGHTTRMAEVLKTFMHARLADVVKGPEDVNYSYVADLLAPDGELGTIMKEMREMIEKDQAERAKRTGK